MSRSECVGFGKSDDSRSGRGLADGHLCELAAGDVVAAVKRRSIQTRCLRGERIQTRLCVERAVVQAEYKRADFPIRA